MRAMPRLKAEDWIVTAMKSTGRLHFPTHPKDSAQGSKREICEHQMKEELERNERKKGQPACMTR